MPVQSFVRRGFVIAVGMAVFIAATSAGILDYTTRDSGRNEIVFFGHSTAHNFEGRTSTVLGKFGADKEKLTETAYADVIIPVKSLKTGISARDKNMYKTFEARKYPNIRFHLEELRDVKWETADTFTALAVGTLTIHGVVRKTGLRIRAGLTDDYAVVDGRADLRITDFGMERPGFLFLRVGDNVEVKFHAQGRLTRESTAS
ncbi:MAG: YceI family protein [Candidatus Hydrogenedentota bacterium]|nr:MAG: YceI family protein [Candidatus Hydrogenedentota bacterium]